MLSKGQQQFDAQRFDDAQQFQQFDAQHFDAQQFDVSNSRLSNSKRTSYLPPSGYFVCIAAVKAAMRKLVAMGLTYREAVATREGYAHRKLGYRP